MLPIGKSVALAVTFIVAPPQPLVTERVGIRIAGLPANRIVSVHAASKALDGVWWRSAAAFRTAEDGSLDLATAKPVSGAYTEADPMGLIWSMRPDGGKGEFFRAPDPFETSLEVRLDRQVLASARVTLRLAAPGVHTENVSKDGLIGALAIPASRDSGTCVIVLGGSEGGFDGGDAALLASHGMTALALGYFGAPGLPPTLQRIPFEYVGRAIRWLGARPGCESVALYGASRGTEAALMAAALYPEVRAVVAQSPSHVLWEGLTENTMPGGPAWTFAGKPLPYLPNKIGIGFGARYLWGRITRTPVPLTPMFLDNLADPGAAAAAGIPVERINGPVLLLAGTDDQKWPSALAAAKIVERLKRAGHPYADELITYEGAGHWIPTRYVPLAGSRKGLTFAIGGSIEGTVRAQRDAWPRIVRFLKRDRARPSSAAGTKPIPQYPARP